MRRLTVGWRIQLLVGLVLVWGMQGCLDPGPSGGQVADTESVADTLTVPDAAPGTETAPPDIADTASDTGPLPLGCCASDSDCGPDASRCVFPDPGVMVGICVLAEVDLGWCWTDSECSGGELCHGAAGCPCDADCDLLYEGPGICVPPNATCASIEESWVKEYCDAANLVIFDGESCIATCPGCCECGPFCKFTYPSLAACEMACLPQECSVYDGALADCPYKWIGEGCPDWVCIDAPCERDQDCPKGAGAPVGPYCVLGNCAFCWQDSECPGEQLCRTGRCVDPKPPACPETPPCSQPGCHLVTPSEAPCPVCVCDSLFGLDCSTDLDCQAISSHPFKRCVYGRCAECRNDDECGFGHCLPPGLCYDMEPPIHLLYGTWLVGWPGGMDHFSYFRFEPDGMLRRGHYPMGGPWADDIPPFPCWPGDEPIVTPYLGTWEPEITASGFLVIRLGLNIPCDPAQGWSARYLVTFGPDPESAHFADMDSAWNYMAKKMPTEACSSDFSLCEPPVDLW